MPYTMQDFRRDTAREYLHLLSPEERLEGLTIEEIEAVLRPKAPSGRGIPFKDRRESARDYLHTLTPEERLRGLKIDEIEALLRKLRSQRGRGARTGSSGKKRPPRQKKT